MTFEKLGIDEDFNPLYPELGIKAPNLVQKKVIPKVLAGKNIVCVAQTGSGKTLAYALPTSEKLKLHEDEYGLSSAKSAPLLVVIAPTKELAVQITGVFKKIAHHAKLRIRSLVGGQRNKMTKSLADQNYEVLVSTPAKLVQAVKKNEVKLDRLISVVFDEADTLFDMGFQKDLNFIVTKITFSQTQVSFFSATMSKSVQEFINTKFTSADIEQVGFKDEHQVQARIETYNIFSSVKERKDVLVGFLRDRKGRGIIFANQKNQVNEIVEYMQELKVKVKAVKVHGDLPQAERLKNMKSFVDGKSQVLIATDVAARGIDVKDLVWVLNFNLPRKPEFYLHRCGRVARAGRSGMIYNIVTGYDSKLIGFINEAIKNQQGMNLDVIADEISKVRAAPKSVKKKVKSKRVKVTKRTRM